MIGPDALTDLQGAVGEIKARLAIRIEACACAEASAVRGVELVGECRLPWVRQWTKLAHPSELNPYSCMDGCTTADMN